MITKKGKIQKKKKKKKSGGETREVPVVGHEDIEQHEC
jgi:hypothetical protein